jgi:hypothetical protein
VPEHVVHQEADKRRRLCLGAAALPVHPLQRQLDGLLRGWVGVTSPARCRWAMLATYLRTVAGNFTVAMLSTNSGTVSAEAGSMASPRVLHHAVKMAVSAAMARVVFGACAPCA